MNPQSEIDSIIDMSSYIKRHARDFYHRFIVDVCCCGTSSLDDEPPRHSNPASVDGMEMDNVVASGGTFVPSLPSETTSVRRDACDDIKRSNEMSFGDYVKMAREKRSE